MEKIVHKFRSFEEADNADYDYCRALYGNEKLQLLLDLIMPEKPRCGHCRAICASSSTYWTQRVLSTIVGAWALDCSSALLCLKAHLCRGFDWLSFSVDIRDDESW